MVSDTRPSTEQRHIELMRQAGPARRAGLAIRLSTSMIRGSRRALARLHPELDERGVQLLWAEQHYGAGVAAALRRRLGVTP